MKKVIWNDVEIKKIIYVNVLADELELRISPPSVNPESFEIWQQVCGKIYPHQLQQLVQQVGEEEAAKVIGRYILDAWRRREDEEIHSCQPGCHQAESQDRC